MNFTPLSRFSVRKKGQRKWHSSAISSPADGLHVGNLEYSSVGKEALVFDLSVRGSSRGSVEEADTALVTSCCRPCLWSYTLSKVSLNNCKGETINVLSYLRLPQLKRWVLNLLSPCFSKQGVRTLLSLRCLLLAANSAAVCCSEENSAPEGSVPFKNKNTCPGCPHKRTRDFLKSLLLSLLTGTHETLLIHKGYEIHVPLQSLWFPLEHEVYSKQKGRCSSEPCRYGASGQRVLTRAHGFPFVAGCSWTLFRRPDSPAPPFSGVI